MGRLLRRFPGDGLVEKINQAKKFGFIQHDQAVFTLHALKTGTPKRKIQPRGDGKAAGGAHRGQFFVKHLKVDACGSGQGIGPLDQRDLDGLLLAGPEILKGSLVTIQYFDLGSFEGFLGV